MYKWPRLEISFEDRADLFPNSDERDESVEYYDELMIDAELEEDSEDDLFHSYDTNSSYSSDDGLTLNGAGDDGL